MIRTFLPATLLLALVACGDAQDPGETVPIANASEPALKAPAPLPEGAERIECAIGDVETFEPVCSVERTAGADGLTLTIRAPHGAFRRLLVTKDGRGVVAADGAMPAAVTPLGPDRIEVAIAGDRYRLPATVRQPGQ